MYTDNSRTGAVIWDVYRYLMRRYGCNAADRDISPLVWYTSTGRSSLDFERSLRRVKPFMIGRLLHQGGSYDEAIDRITAYIKNKRDTGV